jgi:cytochrome c-type biogenesis protein CcmH/NrfG
MAKAPPSTVAASVNPVFDASFVSRSVDVLVSPQASYQQKTAAWKQLRDSGKLDQTIADLEQRTANDPRSADNPAALGHAYLEKCGTIQDVREQGILAMQADKMFDTALGLDTSNWEARFMKAVAMSYWPPMLNKGDEVIQHFQTLIQQQEALTPQPQFADSYAWLGDQYQKAGRAEDAKTVWQRGAALFPADEKLRTKLASKP